MTPNTRRCTGDVAPVVVATTARTALWLGVLLALWCVVPAALGWHVTTVASDSMAPRLRTGDVVAAAPIDGDDVTPGQVLLVDDPDHADRLRLHRLVSHEPDGLRLRGDANAAPDSSLVAAEAVHGVGILRVPWVGAPGLWLRNGEVAPLLVFAAWVAVLAALARLDDPARSGRPCAGCGRPRGDGRVSLPDDARSAALPTVAAFVVLTTALVAGHGTSDAAFSGTTGTQASASTETFSCFVQPLPDSPVLAWNFDEPRGGGVRDSSGNGVVGESISGAIRNDGSCADNPSMGFDQNDARIQATARTPAPSTFSVEVWFRTDRAGGRLVGYSSSSQAASLEKDRQLYIGSDGKVHFGVWGSSLFRFAVSGTEDVTEGEWHHAVGTYRPGALELFVDGTLQARRTDNTSPKIYDGSWRVGRDSLASWPGEPADYTFRGDVDSVRVYDTTLDAGQVAAHHAVGR